LNVAIKEKDKPVALIGLLVFIVLIDVFTLLGWQVRLLFGINEQANTKKSSFATLDADLEKLTEFKKETANLATRVNTYRKQVVKDDEVLLVIETVSNLAKETGVKIMQIKPTTEMQQQEPVEIDGRILKEVTLQITARAGFHQIGNLVSSLEKDARLFKPILLEIEPDAKNLYVQRIQLAISLIVEEKS